MVPGDRVAGFVADPVADWFAAIDETLEDGEGKPPPVPLDELSHWLREGGDLEEIPALALLDEIKDLRDLVAAFSTLDDRVGLGPKHGLEDHELPTAIAACLDAEAEAKRVFVEQHEELRAALEPFAAYADATDAASRPGGPAILDRGAGALISFNQGAAQVWPHDFRRAQVALRGDGERIAGLEAAGHTSHCARRIVWGDGECECRV